MASLRVVKSEIIRHFECPYCLQPLSEDNIELTKTGMIECQNTVGLFNTPCLSEFSLTYCGGCKKIGLTKNMRFYKRKMVGMKAAVRCHVCANGKLSPVFQRAIPHTKQVVIDGGGKVTIKPLEKPQDVIGELVKQWDKNAQFTLDMLGQGEADTSHLPPIPKEFWKSGAVLTGHGEPLSDPYCSRCSEALMKLPDGSMVDFSHVCPQCGVYFNVAPSPKHHCDQCNGVLTKLPDSVVDYTHACPECDINFNL